jgi:hypothetical protein
LGSREIVDKIAVAADWNARVALVRRIPEEFGTAAQAGIYSMLAQRVYCPSLGGQFAFVHWRPEYELADIEAAYNLARNETDGFTVVGCEHLRDVLVGHPQTLRVFRLLLGFTTQEFSEACALVAKARELATVSSAAITKGERGGPLPRSAALTCATVIDLTMIRALFPVKSASSALRLKIDKPDTARGWETVRQYAAHGVPLSVLLHQRAYGGAFRQLLDATSSTRGNELEQAVEDLFVNHGIPHSRTGTSDQPEIEGRFGLTVRPGPDFVVVDPRSGALRAMLECKVANDGGTARDKAARFRALRSEANRLGGIPLFAVLAGRGWRRTADALGPVIRDTDGRTFGAGTLAQMIDTDPFPSLRMH